MQSFEFRYYPLSAFGALTPSATAQIAGGTVGCGSIRPYRKSARENCVIGQACPSQLSASRAFVELPAPARRLKCLMLHDGSLDQVRIRIKSSFSAGYDFVALIVSDGYQIG